jgi:hypothetical protein
MRVTVGFYWYRECQTCRQGRLIVELDTTNDRLLLSCEECTASYWRPEDANQDGKGFLAITADFDTRPATDSDLKRFGWPEEIFKYADQ